MVNGEEDNMPKLVWTFPLVRRVQTRNGILNVGGNIMSMISNRSKGGESGDFSSSYGEEVDIDYGDSDDDDMKEEIESLDESSDLVFGQNGSDEKLVEMEDDTFIPVRTMASEGDTIEWVNNDDQAHKIMSISGEDINSGDIEPGESFTHTFDDEGTTVYVDSRLGGDVMCGAILVGDAELERELPCEVSPQREVLDGTSIDTVGSGATRSMAEAVEDKDNDDSIGF